MFVVSEFLKVSLESNRYMAFARDVTKNKQAEEALRKSEEQYRMIFENSPLGIGYFDLNGTITQCNRVKQNVSRNLILIKNKITVS